MTDFLKNYKVNKKRYEKDIMYFHKINLKLALNDNNPETLHNIALISNHHATVEQLCLSKFLSPKTIVYFAHKHLPDINKRVAGNHHYVVLNLLARHPHCPPHVLLLLEQAHSVYDTDYPSSGSIKNMAKNNKNYKGLALTILQKLGYNNIKKDL